MVYYRSVIYTVYAHEHVHMRPHYTSMNTYFAAESLFMSSIANDYSYPPLLHSLLYIAHSPFIILLHDGGDGDGGWAEAHIQDILR